MLDGETDMARAAVVEGMDARQDDEYVRLRMQHQLHKSAMGGELVKVPDLPKNTPITILDSATGDGRWMAEVAADYPQATFLGTDINPKHFEQLKNLPLPPSIHFKVQSVLDPWPAEDQSAFDLVHQRFCFASFKPADSAAATKRLLNLVKPGRYIQLVDGDLLGFDREGHPATAKLMDFIERAFAQGGMNPIPGRGLKAWLYAAGAVDVVTTQYQYGVGAKAASPAEQRQTTGNIMDMINNFAMIASSECSPSQAEEEGQEARRALLTLRPEMPNYWYTPEDFNKLKAELTQELRTKGNTWRFWVVVARRPA